ncbi:hypothetical protein [Pseudomonas sp. FP2309]|uniref:hypothetical protein n=1 Tax=Pseudomonas sp. FP2309 TaxID=2954091 RepID=UPI002733A88D|nr:hypothetical protein [Pseudomonas sp. FP2309]WLH68725.1 hypothetical protein PSH59_01020 [Pseudomonas sp. FP2309]
MFEKTSFPTAIKTSLSKISESHALRCDSKQFESRFLMLDDLLSKGPTCYLSQFLPDPLVKGVQHIYLEEGEGIPVVNTLSIQKMSININDCRYISDEAFSALTPTRKLIKNDVLLTMDGGTSIGKPVLFDLVGDYSVDSHVAILRPKGISPKALVYLLASPLGQLQFQRFESGASGQTAVTEEDLRRFKFPLSSLQRLEEEVSTLDTERVRIQIARDKLDRDEKELWENFTLKVLR